MGSNSRHWQAKDLQQNSLRLPQESGQQRLVIRSKKQIGIISRLRLTTNSFFASSSMEKDQLAQNPSQLSYSHGSAMLHLDWVLHGHLEMRLLFILMISLSGSRFWMKMRSDIFTMRASNCKCVCEWWVVSGALWVVRGEWCVVCFIPFMLFFKITMKANSY